METRPIRSPEKIVVAIPELRTSSGHNRLAHLLISLASEVTHNVSTITFPNERDPLVSKILWWGVDKGKSSADGDGFISEKLKEFSKWVRSRELVTVTLMRGMLEEYRMGYSRAHVLTSHYMVPLAINHYFEGIDQKPPRMTLLTPDLILHRPFIEAARADNVRVISTSPHATKQLTNAGVSENKITHGMVYPKHLVEASAKRLQHREEFSSSRDANAVILVTLGAGNIYTSEVLKFLNTFQADEQITIRVVMNPGKVNGKLMERSLEFEHEVKKIAESRGWIEIVGDTEMSRDELIELFYEELENPDIQFALTRPNEVPGIVMPLGITPILLPPFQAHEEIARKLILGSESGLDHSVVAGKTSSYLRSFLQELMNRENQEGWEPIFYGPTFPIEDISQA